MWKANSTAFRRQDTTSFWPRGGGKRFLKQDTHTRKLTVNEKIDHCYCIKLKNLLARRKVPLREQKGKPEREKIFAAHVTNKGLICRTYTELLQVSKKKGDNPIKTGQRVIYAPADIKTLHSNVVHNSPKLETTHISIQNITDFGWFIQWDTIH